MTSEIAKVLRSFSASALFLLTIATIAVMWQSAIWATALPEVGVFVLAACWLLFSMVSEEGLHYSIVLIPLTCVALWPLLQLAAGVSIYRWATSIAVLFWAAGAAITFVGLQIFSDTKLRRQYFRALVATGFVLAILAPLQLFTSEARIFWLYQVPFSEIAMGPFLYTNQYAAFIELILPIALTEALGDEDGWRTLHGLAAIVMYASVLASGSRSGVALTSIEIVVVPLLAARRMSISRRQLAIAAGVFLSMLLVLGLAVGSDRLVAKLKQKDPYAGRREYAESSLRMIPDRPILGVGIGNWSAAYPAYATFDEGYFANQAHNDWAQWAVEGGLPFALLMLSVAAWSFPRAIGTGWGLGVAIVFLQCFVDYPIQRFGVAIVFFTLIPAIAYPDERTENRRRSSRRSDRGFQAQA